MPFFAFLLLFWAVFGWSVFLALVLLGVLSVSVPLFWLLGWSGWAWCWLCCCIWSLLGFSWLVVALSGLLALSLSDYSIMAFCASCGFWRGLGFFCGRWWQHLGAVLVHLLGFWSILGRFGGFCCVLVCCLASGGCLCGGGLGGI